VEVLRLIGYAAVAVVVIGWLVVSFSAPSPRRATIEWLSASALYVALLALFVHLVARARAADNTFALVAFGFLCAFFAGGLAVSAWETLRSLRGPAKSDASATN
jgi:hypothetical protein